MNKQPKKFQSKPFQLSGSADMLELQNIMQSFVYQIFWTQLFVRLKIEVDAPGVLADLRPW